MLVELVAGLDSELAKRLAEVVVDGAGADEQLAGDFLIRGTVCRQARDLGSWGVSSSPVSTVRFRACPPVGSSSTRARSANASIPNSVNGLWANRSCSRASSRRRSRRSHSPYKRWA